MPITQRFVSQIEPAFHLKFDVPANFTLTSRFKSSFESTVTISASRVFAEEFGLRVDEFELFVEVRQGSIVIDIAASAAAIWLFLSKYESLEKGSAAFHLRLSTIWSNVSRNVQIIVKNKIHSSGLLLEEERQGYLQQLDILMSNFQNGDVAEDEFLIEGIRIFREYKEVCGKSLASTPFARYSKRQHDRAKEFLFELEIAARLEEYEEILNLNRVHTR